LTPFREGGGIERCHAVGLIGNERASIDCRTADLLAAPPGLARAQRAIVTTRSEARKRPAGNSANGESAVNRFCPAPSRRRIVSLRNAHIHDRSTIAFDQEPTGRLERRARAPLGVGREGDDGSPGRFGDLADFPPLGEK